MAERFVDELTEDFDPESYRDEYRDDLMKRIQAKVKAGKTRSVPTADEVPAPARGSAKVIDLAALLERSLGGRGSAQAGGEGRRGVVEGARAQERRVAPQARRLIGDGDARVDRHARGIPSQALVRGDARARALARALAPARATPSSGTRRAGCTTTSGSSARACSGPGPCRGACPRRPASDGSRCAPRITRSTTSISPATSRTDITAAATSSCGTAARGGRSIPPNPRPGASASSSSLRAVVQRGVTRSCAPGRAARTRGTRVADG